MPQKPKRQPKKSARKKELEKHKITRDQFYKLVWKSAQPTKINSIFIGKGKF